MYWYLHVLICNSAAVKELVTSKVVNFTCSAFITGTRKCYRDGKTYNDGKHSLAIKARSLYTIFILFYVSLFFKWIYECMLWFWARRGASVPYIFKLK